MKKIGITLSGIVIMSLLACSGNSNPEATTEQITQQQEVVVDVTVEQFKTLIVEQGGTVLDVRTPEEWAEGTIANAQKINYFDESFATQVESLDKTAPVFVYCKAGGRSASAAQVLKDKGFSKIYNLDGGITAWAAAGNETVK
ncbi:MAG: rhodanese-like domain-containing protein [Flavobacteriales bacterium]|nr:rhodanese-like domain-containing protein [Flavobacteriales bacterium]